MKKSNNKGFTLVELIVVLVILAILAAILVPALLGYIDRAKESQIVLNARSVYTAAQAELSQKYADAPTPINAAPTLLDDELKRIARTADVTATSSATAEIGVKGTTGHDAYTVYYILYTQDEKTVFYDGTKSAYVTGTGTVKNSVGTVTCYPVPTK